MKIRVQKVSFKEEVKLRVESTKEIHPQKKKTNQQHKNGKILLNIFFGGKIRYWIRDRERNYTVSIHTFRKCLWEGFVCKLIDRHRSCLCVYVKLLVLTCWIADKHRKKRTNKPKNNKVDTTRKSCKREKNSFQRKLIHLSFVSHVVQPLNSQNVIHQNELNSVTCWLLIVVALTTCKLKRINPNL